MNNLVLLLQDEVGVETDEDYKVVVPSTWEKLVLLLHRKPLDYTSEQPEPRHSLFKAFLLNK